MAKSKSTSSKRPSLRAGKARGDGRPSRANGVATQERIIKAATSLFAAGGYEATSLRQIAGVAEIDIATLKYHFGDKPALFARVYQVQHEAFIGFIAPKLHSMVDITTKEGIQAHIKDLVVGIHDFIEDHIPFARMVLYRFLEDSADVIGLEDELQVVAVDMIVGAFEVLQERGLIRPVDARAFVIQMIHSFPMWYVVNQVRPKWYGDPGLYTDEGRERSEAFYTDLLSRSLVL